MGRTWTTGYRERMAQDLRPARLDDRFLEHGVSISPDMGGGRPLSTVRNDLDTLLTALYVEIDDHVVPARRGRGRRPRLSDAELLTLAAAQVLLGIDTEHRWIRFAYCRLGHLFRYLPRQPRRFRRIQGLQRQLGHIGFVA